ncbi:hypothetical protein Acid345_3510 [Candidatus Koribacter versatilis Ellin345]|uniref:CARDB domain-containing protein n=1 Tax=Koribacter versatilis (strain Ellin345) TaxID=204669 RepID=Q1IKT9_KORVE|nr:hypothetical protein [Candidatus Koribacter versatilis]ABF42511.1 hypothetical protein Acid345_3510 [Candidatus Koribacter versatilis Ellin345]
MPLFSYRLSSCLLLLAALPGFSQTAAEPKLKDVEAKSGSVTIYGPFPDAEGPVTATPEPENAGDEDADDGPHDVVDPNHVTTVAVSQTKVSGVAMAGHTAVLASEMNGGPEKVLRDEIVFGESLFLSPSLRSQALTYKFPADASESTGAVDPELAVGTNAVGVLTWDSLVFYFKSGKRIERTVGFTGDIKLRDQIFKNLIVGIDKVLNLNQDVKPGKLLMSSSTSQIGDARLAFDEFHHRFVLLATAKNQSDATDSLSISQRRTKFFLAVSCNEDPWVPCPGNPHQHFHVYGFNAVPGDGDCSSRQEEQCPHSPFTPGNAADYPTLGITPSRYIMAIKVGHAPLDGGDHSDLYSYMIAVNADDVGFGSKAPEIHTFWDWQEANGNNSQGNVAAVVMHDHLAAGKSDDAGMLAKYEDGQIILTMISETNPVKFQSMAIDLPNLNSSTTWVQKGSPRPINYGNVSHFPVEAHFTKGTLVLTFNDCIQWTNNSNGCVPSARLVTLDMANYPHGVHVDIDRVIGWRNFFDDPPNALNAYGLPGAVMNRDGNIAMVFARTGKDLFPEARYSVFLKTEKDIRPSALLSKGTGPSSPFDPLNPKLKPRLLDTAGIALDPFDRTSIWMATFTGRAGTSWKVAVGKVFGEVHPDLDVHDSIKVTPFSARPGDTITVECLISNDGDGIAKNPKFDVLAVDQNNKLTILSHRDGNDYSPGEARRVTFKEKLPQDLPQGKYIIRINGSLAQNEYRTDNDSSEILNFTILPKYTTGGGPTSKP